MSTQPSISRAYKNWRIRDVAIKLSSLRRASRLDLEEHPPSEPLARKTVWSALASASMALGSFGSGIIIARLLGPAATGRIGFLTWISTCVNIVVGLGLPATLTRFIAELRGNGSDKEAQQLAFWLFRIGVAQALLGSLVIIGLSQGPWLPGDNLASYAVLAGAFACDVLGQLFLAFLSGSQRFQSIAVIHFSSGILRLLGTLVGAFVAGEPGALLGYVSGAAVPATAGLLRFFGSCHTIGSSALLRRRVTRFASGVWLAALVSAFVWSRLEIFFLKGFLGDRSVAMFTVGLSLAHLATQAPLLLAGALLPHLSERVGADDIASAHRTYASATRMMAFLVFPLTFGCAAIAPLLLPLFYGIQFAPAIPSSIVLVAGASIGATATVGSSLIYALERSRFIFWSGIPGAFLSVAAGLLIIPRWGVLGAALSRTGVQFAMVALGVWYIHKKLRCPVPFSSVLRTVVASSVAAFGAYACVQVSSDALMTPAAILVAVSLYFLAVRFMKPLTKEDWAALDKATRFLPRAIMAPTGMVIGLLRGRR